MKITNGIVDIAIQRIIPIANTRARPRYSMKPEFITIHNTANAGATAKQNADYVVNQNEYKSWHFTVGNNEIYQHLPINESGWHAGDGEYGTGNRKSIGIEIAEVYGADRTAVKFVAGLLKELGLSIDKFSYSDNIYAIHTVKFFFKPVRKFMNHVSVIFLIVLPVFTFAGIKTDYHYSSYKDTAGSLLSSDSVA
jgi:hypothetical protein